MMRWLPIMQMHHISGIQQYPLVKYTLPVGRLFIDSLPIQQLLPDAAPHTLHTYRSHPPSSWSARHNPRPVVSATPCSQPPDYCPAAARLAVWTASARTRNRSGSGRHSTGKGRFFFASASSFFNSLIFSSNL